MSKVTFKATCLQKGESRVEGFRGTINAMSEQFHGGLQYSLKPPVGDDGKMTEGFWVDEGLLTMPGNLNEEEKGGAVTPNDYFNPCEVDFKFELGDKLKCVLSDFEGRVETRAIWADGCILYLLVSKHNDSDKGDRQRVWFNEAELRFISSGEDVTGEVQQRRTGGMSLSSEIR